MTKKKNKQDLLQEMRLSTNPELFHFCTIANKMGVGISTGIQSLTSPFERLLNKSLLTNILNQELETISTSSSYLPIGSTGTDFVVYKGDHYSLTVKIIANRNSSQNGHLATSPNHHLIGVIGPDSVSLDLHQVPESHQNEVFSKTETLEYIGAFSIKPGCSFFIRADQDVVNLSRSDTPTVALVLSTHPLKTLTWLYAPASLQAQQSVAANPAHSRAEIAGLILAKMRYLPGTETLTRLTSHPAHFVRWSSIASLSLLNQKKAKQALLAAVHDSHPHVRTAAIKTLETE